MLLCNIHISVTLLIWAIKQVSAGSNIVSDTYLLQFDGADMTRNDGILHICIKQQMSLFVE